MSNEKNEVKNMRIFLDGKLHHALKCYAPTKKMTMQEVIAEALKAYLPEELWNEKN
jgi:hypothetical protein